jgi:UDP-glucuronate 4-epimerase
MQSARPQHILLTGVAGFVGFHVASALLDQGVSVTGVDNLNDYYPVALKRDRLTQLVKREGFRFIELDIADHAALKAAAPADIGAVIHLAAQAGVELVRHHPNRPRLAYASSSSVYGDTATAPYSESARVDHPVSLYAATKRSNELTSEAYAKLYGLEQIGLRFFTVYGPWGRPDMAYWTFTRDIIEGRPIKVFNNGELERDFTWIDDIVAGVVATVMRGPATEQPLHRVYNIGNNRPVKLARFITIIEEAVGKKAERIFLPMQAGDVRATCANIDALQRDYGYAPTTKLEQGIPRFVEWYRGWTKT